MLKVNQFWNKLRHLIPPMTRFLLLIAFSCTLVVTIFLTSSTAQLFGPTKSPVVVGWEFAETPELNKGSIKEIEYEGECPGRESGVKKAWFTSTKTPPAPKRRVVVKNVTRGVESNPYPYTDREYEKGRSSEKTEMAFGTNHRGSYLSVIDGENQFEYEIKENNKVIDSGSFTSVIVRELDVKPRNSTVTKNNVCFNSAVALNVCADIRTKTQYTCPNNKILSSIFEPNNSEISTLISNQTFGDMVYVMNGNIHTLRPGEEIKYNGEFLNIQFNPTCASGCNPTTSPRSLQPGKRYQFKSLSGSTIQLVDYPR
jgi:hypothetical protein